MTGELQSFRVYDIDVGRGYGEDNTVWFGNELGDEVTSLLFDVWGLVTDRYLEKK